MAAVLSTLLQVWKFEKSRGIATINASRRISNFLTSKPQFRTSNCRRTRDKPRRPACLNVSRGISNGLFLHPQMHTPSHCRTLFCANAVNNEEAASKANAAAADDDSPTIFDKIIAREIPSSIVYEDEKVLAFRDINPQAPVHVVVIPKCRDGLKELGKAEARHEDILGNLLYATKIVAEKEGIVDGFRVVINSGPAACQSVYHLHLHVLGGRQMKWPPG